MKILVDRPDKKGKGKFLSRLIPEMNKLGAMFVHNPKKNHEIELGIAKYTFNSRSKKVLRIDGLYYYLEKPSHKRKNAEIKDSYDRSDGHIFQSEFTKYACERIFGLKNIPKIVSLNGAPLDYYKNIVPIKSSEKFNIIASAEWRGSKRLKDLLGVFSAWKRKDARLWVAGSRMTKAYSDPRIKVLGYLGDDVLSQYLKMADVCLHISYVDACPNSVVESICAGTPVICGDQGGTPEVVRESGLIIKTDSPYDWNNFIAWKPPKPIYSNIIKALDSVYLNKCKFDMDRPDLDISRVARDYYGFFAQILGGEKMRENFYARMLRADRQKSYKMLAKMIFKEFGPRSIMDYGAGAGFLLHFCRDLYKIYDVNGVEPCLEDAQKVMPKEIRRKIAKMGLDLELDFNREFDLAVCLEVAEHIDARHSDLIVENVTRNTNTVLWSAAVPGQGGVGHVNEQQFDYWLARFERTGFHLDDFLSRNISAWLKKKSVNKWYYKNIRVFRRNA